MACSEISLKSSWQYCRSGMWRVLKRWFIVAFSGMALGLFSTLIIGLIIKQIGVLISEKYIGGRIFIAAGNIASKLTGAGIGGGIAYSFQCDRLILFSSLVSGYLGAQAKSFIMETAVSATGPGDPIGSFLAALYACEVALILKNRTHLDIIVLPFVTILTGVLVVYSICPGVIWLLDEISAGLNRFTELQPFLMGMLLSTVVGLFLTLPTSSAAICIALKLGGVGGAAAAVGGACHMIGFGVISFRDNGFAGLIAQGLGTSMLQISNIVQHPQILIPPVVASLILGPISSAAMKLECDYTGSGMGTSGFVGVIATISASSGKVSTAVLWSGIVFLFFVLPAVITYIVYEVMRHFKWINDGDMKLSM